MKISVVINTLNDEQRLERCLVSVSWADEIVVVDLGSTDKTKEIAEKFKAKIYDHKKVDYVELVRNESIKKATDDWVLLLDPDEEISVSLKEELSKIANKKEYDAVIIARKNIIFGKWISHGTWWPDYKLRFFKKGIAQWSGKIHVDGRAKGRVCYLPANSDLAIIHHAYPDLTSFLERMNRYTDIEAEEKFNKDVRFSFWGMSWSILREFAKRFIKGMAFFDGLHGIVLTILMMYYQFLVWGKLWEKGNRAGGNKFSH